MPTLRTILWIGPGRRFAGDLVADAPTLDVVWENDVTGALRLSFAALDAIVVDSDGEVAAQRALQHLSQASSPPPLLFRIDGLDADAAARLRAAGAADVFPRSPAGGEPQTSADLAQRIEAAIARPGGEARRRTAAPLSPAIVGNAPAIREVFALVARAARSRATVLLTGETGTGKELIARAIHDAGTRRAGPFVAMNCAAFPETLLESELFGHKKGAFTGADRDKPGLIESAERGTLFLDEVTETSGPFQAKLLRVLQEREVRALGGARPRRIDVRVVAASNRDPWADVRGEKFREDLYYRLAVFPIHVPPLRDRSGDVAALARHFLALHGRREGVPGVTLSEDAVQLLDAYRWPGNVRELENEIQRALALASAGEALGAGHFSKRLVEAREPIPSGEPLTGDSLRAALQRYEARLIRHALAQHSGRRAATARTLGITREGLYKKMKRFGIE